MHGVCFRRCFVLVAASVGLAAGCGDDPSFPTFADADADADANADSDSAADVDAISDAVPDLRPDDDGGSADTVTDTVLETGADGDMGGSTFVTCADSAFTDPPTADWQHPILTGAIAFQSPGHSIEDVIAPWPPAAAIEIEGKFAYGVLSNDLDDEYVYGFVDTCDGWAELGRLATDSDGRVRFSIGAELLPAPGRYALRMVVEGDASVANGWLLSIPAGAELVVFDIDGTLTTSDAELVSDFVAELFNGDFVPEAYEGAVDVVEAYAAAGYEIVYLTARPYWVDGITRGWLSDLGFPVGTTHFTRDFAEALPTETGVGAFKRDYLIGLDGPHDLVRAYGNSDTDVFAYLGVGLSTEDVYVIGDQAGLDGTQPITTYPDHLSSVTIEPADQPWQ